MTKKLLSIILASVMVVTFIPTFSFAEVGEKVDDAKATELDSVEQETSNQPEDYAEIMEDAIDISDVNDDVTLDDDEFVAEGDDVDIVVSKDGDGCVSMETDENAEQITMSLPDEVADATGVLTDDGTIVYDSKDKPLAVGVQALSAGTGNNHWEALRILLTIDSADASKEYAFNYALPDGYKIIKAEDWYDRYIKSEETNAEDYFVPGEVCVIDEEGAVMETIDPAWAVDANGKAVSTHYKINGNELVQVVDFTKDTAFPVVADPTSHPNKYTTITLNEAGVKKNRSKAQSTNSLIAMIKTTSSGAVAITGYLASSFAPRAAELLGGAGTAWTMIDISNTVYEYVQYSTWNKVYKKLHNNSNYNYVKIKYRWKWHGGHKTYYPSGKEVLGYYKKK